MVFLDDKGTAQFKRLSQRRLETAVHAEEALQVEAFHPVAPEYLLPLSYPVGPYNQLLHIVPDKELVVIEVILIQVHGVVGPLPHIAEGDFP